MAMRYRDFGSFWSPGCLGALGVLLCAAACGGERSTKGDESAEKPAATSTQAATKSASEEAPDRTLRAPVPEDAGESAGKARVAGYYQLDWSGDDVCPAVLGALNESAPAPGPAADYADAQARALLKTRRNLEWTAAGEGNEAAIADYFNDGVNRRMQRRTGMLSGARIITLWIDDGGNGFARLDYGHAGANTAALPENGDLHTKLTYSVADIVNIGGRYVTLVAPLKDVDASGAVFAISWRAKDGAAAPYAPQDYYAYVSCVMTPAKSDGEAG